ncbi:phage terminase large subunit family protein [Paenibacillus cisolokensis]|uniref:phage terminase large subunit family protein n=1 Tax=Paenibacillus cisolokensis TaxID=1658519 RepID=UPI003D2A6345
MTRTDQKTVDLFRRIARVVAPPPKLTVSEWADQFRRLSSEASAEPGQWRTDRAPYQREIMDALNDDETETIVVMSSAQVGKTEIILNIIGYFVHQDPSPIMLVQPTLELAQAFSKDRLSPMVRDSPELKKRMASAKSRDSGNTMLHKTFPGGHITMAGANSPASLASRPIRVVLLDEVDRYPPSAGTEGDPVTLVSKRSTTFSNRKRVMVSTPTIKGASRIETAYESSSMEQWCLPCPSCGEHQPLEWGRIRFEDASMACKHCGAIHGELEWKAGKGKWIARKANRKVRGFHLNELASPWKRWATIIEEFLEAKRSGLEMLKAWINTSLGETWEERGTGVDADELADRREEYEAEVPDEVLMLTCGVDVQDNRLEYEVVGWGPEAESWGIQYGVIMGDPGQDYVWDMLDAQVIDRSFVRRDGQELQVLSTAVDSGGHFTKEVYTFCKKREMRRVWAIKGKGGVGVPYIVRPKRRNDEGVWLFTLGVDVGKDTLSSRLALKEPGPGYCHFPADPKRGYDDSYFPGLTSEHRVMRYIKGRPIFYWEKKVAGGRNEPLDCRNYATAALEISGGVTVLAALQRMREKEAEPQQTQAKPLARRRAGVVSKGID